MNYLLNEGYKEKSRATHAIGAYIKIDDNWCIDTLMGAGTHILGHGFCSEYIKNKLQEGTLFTYPNPAADECGRLLYKATGFKHFIFANSGMEAVSKAIRAARAYTGRDKIALMEGGWHGCHDYGLIGYSDGIPQAVKDTVLTLPYTDEAFDVIDKEKPAAVIIEPIQGSLPVNRFEFIKKLSEAVKRNKTLLCFDEVITGFRMALGGGKEYFGIKPDLACYGKTVGGGFPVGVIAGDKVLERDGVKYGGTFSANPITAAACNCMLDALIKTNPYFALNNKTELLKFSTKKLQVIGFANYYKILFTPKECNSIQDRNKYQMSKNKINAILKHLLDKGIYVGNNHKLLLSTKHSYADIGFIKRCLTEI